MKNVSYFLRILVCILFFVNLIVSCKKDEIHLETTQHLGLPKNTTKNEAQLIPITDQPEMTELFNLTRPQYPYSDGTCKLIFIVRGFDPTLPLGGSLPPCPFSSIYFKAYSQPNGLGTLLYSGTMQITGDWQTWEIPSSGYIQFMILQDRAVQGESNQCHFKFLIGEFGWNRPELQWVNLPYDQWFPVITGRFAPKDTSPIGAPGRFDEYLCDSWCTWTLPISFTWNEPPQFPSLVSNINCYYGASTAVDQDDPRFLKSHVFYSDNEQTAYMYPVSEDINEPYITEANNLFSSDATIQYNILGFNGLGVGPFSWGVAPYPVHTNGDGCSIQLVR
jgi:hypothetical protein